MMREQARERLVALEQETGGPVTPEMVVTEAADKESPLHDYFEWDDEKAGHAYRLDQARTLIRAVRVVSTTDHRKVSSVYYVRDPRLPHDKQGYVSIPKLRTDADAARDALVYEFSRAAAALDRAHKVAAALDLEGEVKELTERVRQLSEHVSATAQ